MLKPNLKYSRELKTAIEVKESMTSDEALHLLVDELLGPSWYITDPVGPKEANAIMVNSILQRYAPRKRLK